jgi:hypothetical protein
MPTSLYWAYAALQRYILRYGAFAAMLTSEYPWGMLGDRDPLDSVGTYGYQQTTAPFAWPGDAPTTPAVSPAPFPGPPPPPEAGVPAPTETSTGPLETQPGQSDATPAVKSGNEVPGAATASDPPPVTAAWGTQPPPRPPSWMSAPPPSSPPSPGWMVPPNSGGAEIRDRGWLTLPSAARGWLVFAIIWGAILFGASTVVNSIQATNRANQYSSDYTTVVNDFNNSKAAVDAAIAQTRNCTTVPCLRASHLAAAASLHHFASDVRAMNLPSGSQQTAQSVESDATQLADAFTRLANSANGQAYHSIVQSTDVNTLLQTLPNDTNTLLSQLNHYLECPPSANGLAICG